MGVNERKIEAQSGAGGTRLKHLSQALARVHCFRYGCILCIPEAATPFDCRRAGGRVRGKELERNWTPLSVSLSDSANLVFKARATLSLRHLKLRLVQQLCQLVKKWPRARSSHEQHSVILRFLSRNFGLNHYFGGSTQ